MKLFIVLSITLLLSLFYARVYSVTETRSPALTPRQIFNSIDLNKDGFITQDEGKSYLTKLGAPQQQMAKILQEIWSKEDGNKDGVISWEEWHKVNAPIIESHANNNNNNNNAAATATTPTPPNANTSTPTNNNVASPSTRTTMSTLSLGNNNYNTFATDDDIVDEHSNDNDDDESVDEDSNCNDEDETSCEEEDYFWLDFSDDATFCTDEKRKLDDCWYKVYHADDCGNGKPCHYACIVDDSTDETKCYSVLIDECDDDNVDDNADDDNNNDDNESH